MEDVAAPAPAGVPMYDISGQEAVLGHVPHEDVEAALTSGKFSLPKGDVQMFNPDGELGNVPAEQAAEAIQSGFKYATPGMLQQHKYAGSGQGAIAGAEGLAEGVLGPAAPFLENQLLTIPKEDILGRREEHGVAHGVGQAVGLVGSTALGFGEGALMAKAGEAAAGATGLMKGTELAAELAGPVRAATWGERVGSEAVKQAAEMAVLQGSDEAAKMLLNDPNTSAESAIANVGLATALGAGGGAFWAGAVSPLWKATVGDKVGAALSGISNRIDGVPSLRIQDGLQKSFDELGFQPAPALRAALSGDPKALEMARTLYRGQHEGFAADLAQVPKQLQESVASALGISLDDAAHFSNAESGEAVRNAFIDHVDKEYGPIADALNKRNAEAATISVPDDDRRALAGRIMEAAMKHVGTDSPFYKTYENYAQRVMARDTIGQLDQLTSEMSKSARSMSLDNNEKFALQQMRRTIEDFKEAQIARQAKMAGKDAASADAYMELQKTVEATPEGVGSGATRARSDAEGALKDAEKQGIQEGKEVGAQVINNRAEVNRNYAEYAQKLNELGDKLGLGDFKGTGTLKEKLNELTSEQVLKKFSTRKDAEIIEFLQKNFPETAELVRQHEAKKFVASVVKQHEGESVVDIKSLAKKLEALRKGSPEYADFVLGPQAQSKIEAAKSIMDGIGAVTGIKDSGTPGGLGKVFNHLGAGAVGAVAFLMGHNPISGAMIGEMAQKLGKDAPEGIKYGLLKFLASDQPIKAEGFKAMVDFMHDAIRAQTKMSKGAAAVFKPGAQVLTEKMMPAQADRDKLDKTVVRMQQNPQKIQDMQQNNDTGHYLPDHAAGITLAQSRALQYLDSIKPKPQLTGPLDRPVPPNQAEKARYNRALDIAQEPLVVLDHVKKGTLQVTDIQDLKAMYPGIYQQMSQKLTNEMTTAHDKGYEIPYKTRMGMSLFFQQPLDSTMQPLSIQAAQPKPPQQPQGGAGGGGHKGSMKALGKSNDMALTPGQAAQKRASTKD